MASLWFSSRWFHHDLHQYNWFDFAIFLSALVLSLHHTQSNFFLFFKWISSRIPPFSCSPFQILHTQYFNRIESIENFFCWRYFWQRLIFISVGQRVQINWLDRLQLFLHCSSVPHRCLWFSKVFAINAPKISHSYWYCLRSWLALCGLSMAIWLITPSYRYRMV